VKSEIGRTSQNSTYLRKMELYVKKSIGLEKKPLSHLNLSFIKIRVEIKTGYSTGVQ
jgi:hypothetical protein